MRENMKGGRKDRKDTRMEVSLISCDEMAPLKSVSRSQRKSRRNGSGGRKCVKGRKGREVVRN